MDSHDIVVDLENAEILNLREVLFDTSRTLPQALYKTWAARGDNIAITHGYSGRQLRFSELIQSVHRLAGAFSAEGLRKGDGVLVLANNSLEVYIALFAVWFIGATAILANTSWTFEFIVTMTEGHDILWVIADGASMSLAAHLVTSSLSTMKRVFYTDDPLSIPAMISFTGDQKNQADAQFPLENTANPRRDVVFVTFTSATSGKPKAVPVTHFRFLAMFATAVDCGLYGSDKHVLTWAPPYHLAGVTVTTATLLCGARVVIVPELTAPMDPQRIAFICRNHKVNRLIGSSDFIAALMKDNLKADFESISSIITGGFPPVAGELEAMRQYFGPDSDVKLVYGTAETLGAVIVSSQENSPPTKGLPLPHIRIRILNSKQEAVAPGTQGEILIKGRSVISEYWHQNDSLRYENFTRDGWFRTGDVGFYDEYGNVTIVGQMQDIIPLEPQGVHCSVFEEFFLKLQFIREVKVVAIPRDDFVEIVACIVPDPGIRDEELIAQLKKELEFSDYPLNLLSTVFLFDDLPRTAWRRPSRRIIIRQIQMTTL